MLAEFAAPFAVAVRQVLCGLFEAKLIAPRSPQIKMRHVVHLRQLFPPSVFFDCKTSPGVVCSVCHYHFLIQLISYKRLASDAQLIGFAPLDTSALFANAARVCGQDALRVINKSVSDMANKKGETFS